MKSHTFTIIFLLPCFLFIFATSFTLDADQTCKPSGKIRGKKPPPKQCNRENDSDCCIKGKSYTTYKCSPPVSRSTKATLTLFFDTRNSPDERPILDPSPSCKPRPNQPAAQRAGLFSQGLRPRRRITRGLLGWTRTSSLPPTRTSTCVKAEDRGANQPGWKPVVTKATLTLNSFEKGGDGGGASKCDEKFHSDDTLVVALSTGWFKKKGRCLKYIYIYGNGRRVKALVVDECDSTMGCDPDHDYQPPCPNNIVDASRAVWKALGVPEKDWGELVIHWSDA